MPHRTPRASSPRRAHALLPLAAALLLAPSLACAWPSTDAAALISGGSAVFTQGGSHVIYGYQPGNARIESGPAPIVGRFADGWPSSWSGADAAVNLGNGKIYFFRGAEYIRYNITTRRIEAAPARILYNFSHNWPAWPSVDAAVNLGKGKVYFFRGRDYIRYDISAARIEFGPARIAGNFANNWPSWPRVDSAMHLNNGSAYFFFGSDYVAYDIASGKVTSAPKPIAPANFSRNWPGGPKSLTLVKAICLKPATGIERDVVRFIDGFVNGFNIVWGPGSKLLGLFGPEADVAVGVVDLSIAALDTGSKIASAVDRNRAPDQLYIKLDGSRVWPQSAPHQDVRGGQTVQVGARAGGGRHRIELFDHDSGSNDDSLGWVELEPGQPGVFTVELISKREDSAYLLEFEVSGR